MGKKWIMFFIVAFMVVFAATAYADKMVIVLDPNNPDSFTCYRMTSFNPTTTPPTATGVQTCSRDAPASTGPHNPNLQMRIRDQRRPGNPSASNHPILRAPDGTLLFSNPCVTYWYGSYSYTVCN
jgi:hypothetical protein